MRLRGAVLGRHVVLASGVADQARRGAVLVSLVREVVAQRGDVVFGESRTVRLTGLAGEHLVHRIIH